MAVGAGRFDVAFCDPPYAFDDWADAARGAAAEVAVLESSSAIEVPGGVGGREVAPLRRYARDRGPSDPRPHRGRPNGPPSHAPVKVALVPGSFDPFHNGHLEVVERAARLFDEVVVAAMRNPQKSEPLFDLTERQEMLEESLAHLPGVRIVSVSTLVVNVARDVGASAIVKGLRAVSDFENELQMAQMNRQLSGVETIFIPTSSTHSFVASRLLARGGPLGGDVSAFVPKPVADRLGRSSARDGGRRR